MTSSYDASSSTVGDGREPHPGAEDLEPAGEVAQRLGELLLAGDPHRQPELATDLRALLEQGDREAALGGARRGGEARRAGPHDGDARWSRGVETRDRRGVVPTSLDRRRERQQHELGLAPRPRVDQAGRLAVGEDVVEAGLVAGDAGVDLVGPPGGRLRDELRVGQERTRHRHQIGLAGSEDLLGQLGGVDPVGGTDRDRHLGLQPGGHRAPGAARHLGDDRGDPRLVPADAGVEHGGAGLLESVRQVGDLVPGLAPLDQVEQRDPVDDREAVAHGLPRPAYDLDGEAHPFGRGAAPGVGAVVGPRGQHLVDQVALGAHDLDGVVAGLLGQARRPGEVADRPVHAPRAQGRGGERGDRRLRAGGAHAERVVGVAPGVQHLEGDRPALLVHGVGHLAVPHRLEARRHVGGERLEPAPPVRSEPAGDDEAGAAPRALADVRREGRQVADPVLEPGVHRAHDQAVAQRQVAQRDRFEEVRVAHPRH